jgi:hypothetical protein
MTCLESPSSSSKLKLVTLSTNEGPGLSDWLLGAEMLGYDFEVLGRGEKWGGWPWRTKKYIEYVSTLPSETIVCLIDGNDILFQRGPHSLIEVYLGAGKGVIFGGEPSCCTGKYKYTPLSMTGARDTAINTLKARKPPTRWYFPNAGCIMGTRNEVLRVLNRVKGETDDQAGHLDAYLKDESYLSVDYHHGIVGGVNTVSWAYNTEVALPLASSSSETPYWELVNAEDIPDAVSPAIFRNRITRGIPCILHFAGGNTQGMDSMGVQLFGKRYKRVTKPIPPPVGRSTALFSIAKLWK